MYGVRSLIRRLFQVLVTLWRRKPSKHKPKPSPSPEIIYPPVLSFDVAIVTDTTTERISGPQPSPHAHPTAPSADLGKTISSDLLVALVAQDLKTDEPVKVARPTDPDSPIVLLKSHVAVARMSASIEANTISGKANNLTGTDSWVDLVKGSSKQLKKKGTGFAPPSGETCVKIPNTVIEKNRKAWDCFVLGQFYSDTSSQGTIHNIVNGIWSKQLRDIAVSKMEGHAFLF